AWIRRVFLMDTVYWYSE
ncbi:hypothetical protein Tco_1142917, partial [Tanacetum coccineum]